jgi:hypothetical protein
MPAMPLGHELGVQMFRLLYFGPSTCFTLSKRYSLLLNDLLERCTAEYMPVRIRSQAKAYSRDRHTPASSTAEGAGQVVGKLAVG